MSLPESNANMNESDESQMLRSLSQGNDIAESSFNLHVLNSASTHSMLTESLHSLSKRFPKTLCGIVTVRKAAKKMCSKGAYIL